MTFNNFVVRKQPAVFTAVLVAIISTGCATPATEVKVPTMNMDAALAESRAAQSPAQAIKPQARIVRSVLSPDRPAPLVSAPDVRLAYVFEWTDTQGNLHYPGWVAIPVDTFKWIIPDVGTVPMDGSVANSPIATPSSTNGRNR